MSTGIKSLEKLSPERRIAEIEKRQEEYKKQLTELRKQERRAKQEADRKREKERTRAKIVVGATVLEAAKKDPALRSSLVKALEGLKRKQDAEAVAEELAELKKVGAK